MCCAFSQKRAGLDVKLIQFLGKNKKKAKPAKLVSCYLTEAQLV